MVTNDHIWSQRLLTVLCPAFQLLVVGRRLLGGGRQSGGDLGVVVAPALSVAGVLLLGVVHQVEVAHLVVGAHPDPDRLVLLGGVVGAPVCCYFSVVRFHGITFQCVNLLEMSS